MPNTCKPSTFLWIAAACLVSGCGGQSQPAVLQFAAVYGDHDISCNAPAEDVVLTDLRFFVHDISLIDESGRALRVELLSEDTWQDGRVALLDFEDGQGACLNGSPAMNTSVRGSLRGAIGDGRYRGVTFTLGVPAELNHGDPMIASPPLNHMPMHWHWLSGYKFLRAGISRGADSFWLHLGSSHCDGSIGEGIHCRSPNRVSVSIEPFDPLQQRIALDLRKLFAGVDLTDGIVSDCSSGPAEAACAEPFVALGIPFQKEHGVELPQPAVFRSVPSR